MTHKRSFVFVLALLVFSLTFVAFAFAQEGTQEASPTPEVESGTPAATATVRPDFELQPEATLDPSMVFVTPLQDNAVVNIRRGPGLRNGVRGILRPSRYLEAIATNGFDPERTCSTTLSNDLDMWIQVRFNEGEAWVARCVVEVLGDVSNLPIAEGYEATAEATANTSVDTVVNTPTPEAEATTSP